MAALYSYCVTHLATSADAYFAFHKANSSYMASLGIDHEKGTETMRLLSLCSLAAATPVLSYEAVAKALQVR
jgi:hypothetical protein